MRRSLIEILCASNGDITERGLRSVGIGYGMARAVVLRLDELRLTRRVGSHHQRELIAPLSEIAEMLAGEHIETIDSFRQRPHRVPYYDTMRVLDDPSGLFAPGAIFPSDQVLPRHYAPDEPGQWPMGTRFARQRPGHRNEIYIYDGEQVRPE